MMIKKIDLAKELGFSPSVVSKALSRGPKESDKCKAKKEAG